MVQGYGAAMRASSKVLLIGFGNMGRALARGWLARGYEPAALHAVDPAPAARAAAEALGIATSARPADAAGPADVVVVAVKPAEVAAALAECAHLRSSAGAAPVFLSIAAGKTLAAMGAAVGAGVPAVRAMPNTPAAIGQGMTVLVANEAVGAAERALCTALLEAVGAVAWVEDEGLMDAVTAVSGSGPAYVFLLIESLEQAAIAAGLDAALARTLATTTVAGAGAYAAAAGVPAAELRRQVTSPAGTTAAALEVLARDGGLPRLLERAVEAAARRSRELAQ